MLNQNKDNGSSSSPSNVHTPDTTVAKMPQPPVDMNFGEDLDDIWGLITSPMNASDTAFGEYINDSPLFGEGSPMDETPLMSTPALGADGMFAMDTPDIYTSPALLDYNTFESTSGVGVADLPTLLSTPAPAYASQGGSKEMADTFEGLFRMPDTPLTPALDPSTLHTPATPALDYVPPTPATSASLVANNESEDSASRSRKKVYTGTRPNMTTASLIPMDAPIQSRHYVVPSATSRKEFPSHFRKRSAASAGLDEDEVNVDTSLQRQIEAKRQSNTLAARRSRHRKQQYLQQLEDENTKLREELTAWTQRALKAEAELEKKS